MARADVVMDSQMQLKFLNEGLRRFDALIFMPVYLSFWIITGVLGGVVYFQECVHSLSAALPLRLATTVRP